MIMKVKNRFNKNLKLLLQKFLKDQLKIIQMKMMQTGLMIYEIYEKYEIIFQNYYKDCIFECIVYDIEFKYKFKK